MVIRVIPLLYKTQSIEKINNTINTTFFTAVSVGNTNFVRRYNTAIDTQTVINCAIIVDIVLLAIPINEFIKS